MKSLTMLHRAAAFALNAVPDSFSPSITATAASIRRNGAICILLGFLCLATFAAWVSLFNTPTSTVLVIPSLMAYALFSVGGYRVIRGKDAKASHPGEISWSRIAIGCGSVAFCFAMLVGFGFLLDWIMG